MRAIATLKNPVVWSAVWVGATQVAETMHKRHMKDVCVLCRLAHQPQIPMPWIDKPVEAYMDDTLFMADR